MKWYPNLAQAIFQALEAIFNQERQADKTIQSLLKAQKKWGGRDRRFVAQVLYDIVRWKRLYEYLGQTNILTPQGKWQVLGVWAILNHLDLPDWAVFKQVDTQLILQKNQNITNEAVKQSVPDWLYELGLSQLKHNWVATLKALNEEAPVTVRANRLKINSEQLKRIFGSQGIETYQDPAYPEALFLKDRKKLTGLKSYRQGLFEIQDASSQLVAPFTGAKAGAIVIDACAGAGGKTLHLATQMQNKGQIKAYDIYPAKIEELRKRARRNGVKNIVESGIIDTEVLKKNHEKADILLLDAPCSSLGTLRRNPGLKWQLKLEKIKQINVIQHNILDTYESMLKPGGHLIYVTCSVLPSENQLIVKNFLSNHKNYTFVADKIILPSQAKGDGFYMAKLKKHNI